LARGQLRESHIQRIDKQIYLAVLSSLGHMYARQGTPKKQRLSSQGISGGP